MAVGLVRLKQSCVNTRVRAVDGTTYGNFRRKMAIHHQFLGVPGYCDEYSSGHISSWAKKGRIPANQALLLPHWNHGLFEGNHPLLWPQDSGE